MTEKSMQIRQLGLTSYLDTYQAMHNFTTSRTQNTQDEIWLVEHFPTFTQGRTGKAEHILRTSHIPIVHTDRGGQVTYHSPGQQIMYVMIDLRRAELNIRTLVDALEQSVTQTLSRYHLDSYTKPGAPGVYIDHKKIASLGLHVKKGCTLHGLALNIKMDLSPFNDINPCGYQGLQMTQLHDYIPDIDQQQVCQQMVNTFTQLLHYDNVHYEYNTQYG
ncbi:lipoyl(octanoyl) transferase LipB [Zophobihabitans entericus]|uniref:Octanoyltransferase n=1 Tax=Zophobihabitans entericus TaxID=1635327 RepID=A0A6G9IC07_9GAMM|nr:lipoyl(octanoyl) transferase LipB [Zophobihabitans entericus]QIQ21766.1 lipoyl(octanoyl) transferase LipB [Zophobihabitans entericus]